LGGALVLGGICGARSAETPKATGTASPVQVYVQQSGKPSAVTYRYRVVNGSPTEIAALWIGFDMSADFQLTVGPVGWDGQTLPAASYRTPKGWHFNVYRTEEDSVLSVCWEVDTALTTIRSGATMSGFEVTLPKPDSLYVMGTWSATVTSGPHFTGFLKTEPRTAGRERSSRKGSR
jgi:hypothetical protein